MVRKTKTRADVRSERTRSFSLVEYLTGVLGSCSLDPLDIGTGTVLPRIIGFGPSTSCSLGPQARIWAEDEVPRMIHPTEFGSNFVGQTVLGTSSSGVSKRSRPYISYISFNLTVHITQRPKEHSGDLAIFCRAWLYIVALLPWVATTRSEPQGFRLLCFLPFHSCDPSQIAYRLAGMTEGGAGADRERRMRSRGGRSVSSALSVANDASQHAIQLGVEMFWEQQRRGICEWETLGYTGLVYRLSVFGLG